MATSASADALTEICQTGQPGGQQTLPLLSRDIASRCQNGFLSPEKLLNTRLAIGQHRAKLPLVERRLLTGALKLDEFARFGHDDVHVHLRRRVFDVTKVERHLLVHDPDAYRR